MTATIVSSARFSHPSEAAYCAGCRCDQCVAARYRSAKAYRHRVAATGPALVDADPAARHVAGLLAAGHSTTVIAALAGIDRTTVANIARRRQPTVTRSFADRLLKLTVPIILNNARDGMRVPAIGARRRIRALQALGWPIAVIADAADGVSVAQLDWAARHADSTIRADTHRSIVRVYDLLAMRTGPSRRTRAWATRTGHAPPLAWDDDEIDDPAATPHQPAEAAHSDRAERDRQIALLTTAGRSASNIADKLDCTPRTIQRARNRNRHAAARPPMRNMSQVC